ncbi:MAG TPA: ABC transporter permease [Hyphomonadaceae bacterium]|nr:ABC transporter permease [Hyphomonadaceae bacterium]
MIIDTIRAEIFKLMHNRWTLFWAFMAAPAATLVFGIVLEVLFVSPGSALSSVRGTALVQYLLDGCAIGSNLLAQLLLIMGAATIFAGEYQWQTWRAIVPRSSRGALMVAKFVAFGVFAVGTILGCTLAELIISILSSLVTRTPINWPQIARAEALTAMGVVGLASLIEALLIAAMVAVGAVLMRSVLASALTAFFALVGLELIASRIPPNEQLPIDVVLPGFAASSVSAWADAMLGNSGSPKAEWGALGLPALGVEFLLFALVSLALFLRQDLSRE